MNRIFITGDLHLNIDIKKLSFKNWPSSRELDKEDTLIICGDAGLTWNDSNEVKYWCDWLEDRPYTVISVLGNHENYDLLRAIPITEWHGAKVRRVRPHVMYIENGEIFTINNQTFFCMGGATSVDKVYRKEGKSWWPQEIPTWDEMDYAANNLRLHNFQVDNIITHCGPNYIVDKLFPYENAHDDITNFLEKFVRMTTTFNKWYMGHYHVDRCYDDQKFNILYQDILEIMPDRRWEIIA